MVLNKLAGPTVIGVLQAESIQLRRFVFIHCRKKKLQSPHPTRTGQTILNIDTHPNPYPIYHIPIQPLHSRFYSGQKMSVMGENCRSFMTATPKHEIVLLANERSTWLGVQRYEEGYCGVR